jgi:type IV pilus assembly protein PilQ
MLGIARRMALLTLVPAVAAAGELQTGPATIRLDDVIVAAGAPGATTVHLKTSGRAKYQAEYLASPPRVVVDLEDTMFAWRRAAIQSATQPVRQIRGSQYRRGVARVVVELTGTSGYVIREDAEGLAIVLTSLPVLPPISVSSLDALPVSAPDVDIPRGAVRLAQASSPARPAPAVQTPAGPPAQTTGRMISLDFKDADVVNLLRILAAESGKNIVISDDVKGKMSITLKNVPWEQALDIILEARGLKKVERDNVIRIVTNEQLAREREAAARLEEARAKAEEAKAKSDAEVRAKAAEAAIKEQEAQQRKFALEQAIAEQQARGPLREETIRLAYADPDDVAKTLQGLLGITGDAPAAPPAVVVPPAGPPFSALYGQTGFQQPPPPPPAPDVLAKGITIRAHRPSNSIFIRHYDKDLERIKKLIRETLDVQLPQIKIEARLNELSRSDLFDIGVQWGGAGARRDGERVLVGQGTAIDRPTAGIGGLDDPDPTSILPLGSAASRVPLSGLLPVSRTFGLPLGGNIVNLPLGLGAPTAGIGFGIIGTRFSLNLALQALESQSKTRSLAKPEIVTVENATASISLGSEIPYATVSSAGTQIQFKEAVLKLEVRPTVIREPEATKIKMRVIIEDNSQGNSVPSGSAGGLLPTINKRRAETEVVVKEGESLVIGGITQRTESEAVRKVPLFGDVPVLGWLFKTKSFAVTPDRELIVFITPSVLRDALAATGPTQPRTR